MIKILAISGSLRPNSSNQRIIDFISKLPLDRVEIYSFNHMNSIPLFNDSNGGSAVDNFRASIRSADGVLICTPEYAFGIPGALKNALDWTVSTGDLYQKPVALITASTGGEYAHQALQWVLQALGAEVNDESTLLVSFIKSKLKDGQWIDTETREAIKNLVLQFSDQLKKRSLA